MPCRPFQVWSAWLVASTVLLIPSHGFGMTGPAYPCALYWQASGGETWTDVAMATTTTPEVLQRNNPGLISPFQKGTKVYVRDLCHPTEPSDHYVVRPGDTLYSIAKSHGLHVSDLKYHNASRATCFRSASNCISLPSHRLWTTFARRSQMMSWTFRTLSASRGRIGTT